MCCKNKARRSGGCCSRRYNNYASNPLSLGGNQAPVVVYERRPGLVGMLARHIAQKRQAKQQQQVMGYQNQPKQAAFVDERKVEEERKMMERLGQAMWDEKRHVGVNEGVGAGVDHVQRQGWVSGNGYNRYSTMSVGTELPSYGQAMKQ